MGVLDQVIQMKRQGASDEEIIGNLSQQKISPREINDALKQAQIKNAVSDLEDADMQPSMMDNAPMPSQQDYEPQAEEYPPAQEQYAPQQVGYSQEQAYAPETQGEGYSEYQPGESGGIDTDTVMEIAGQIFSEKIKKIQTEVEKNSDNYSLLQSKVESLSERLKKIETTMDKLQIAILEKVGSYGQNLDGIRKEMSMMQDSFSKMVSSPKEEKPREERQAPAPRQEVAKPKKQNVPVEQEENTSEMPDELAALQKKISRKK